jgi:hypothetical protein
MGILTVSSYARSETGLVRLAMSTGIGGLFWGMVVTLIVKKFRKWVLMMRIWNESRQYNGSPSICNLLSFRSL